MLTAMSQRSISSTIAVVLYLILFLSAASAVVATYTLSRSLSDAEAVNISGSLRMQSYRLAYGFEKQYPDINSKVALFEASLNAPALTRLTSWDTPQVVSDSYLKVVDYWQRLKPTLASDGGVTFRAQVAQFVDTIDRFVKQVQLHSEAKARQLAISQGIGLGLILIIALVTMRFTRRQIVAPLTRLVAAAERIKRREFNIDIGKPPANELGMLASTLATTSAELGRLYDSLEQKVAEKTDKLQQANDSLGFLYENSQALHVTRLTHDVLIESLSKLQTQQQCRYVRLIIQSLHDRDTTITTNSGWPESSQASCRLPLEIEDSTLGWLELITTREPDMRMLQNFTMMLARALVHDRMNLQQLQLALMEERGVIARELHDSLAQSLSYLRIQITLLRRQLQQGNKEAALTLVNELNNGLGEAYMQLRELLSTFRLTIKEADLASALEMVLDQLRSQTHAELVLDYQIPSHLLAAQQHIHILQIVREAVINAIKHANASEIRVSARSNSQQQIEISVQDNGRGIGDNREKQHHYGLTIMHERTAKLAGNLAVSGSPDGGTEVSLTFPAGTLSSGAR